MITNFETITQELTEVQKQQANILASILRTTSKKHQFKNKELAFIMFIKHDIKCNAIQVRKMINHIRSSGTLPVIGTSKGYYISFDQDDIKKAIQGQEERIRQQQRAVNGMKKFII